MTDDKDNLDRLIRAAATPPMGNEPRLRAQVRRRLSGEPKPSPQTALGPVVAVAGFSALLVATPILVAGMGPTAENVIFAITTGDPSSLTLPGDSLWQ